MNILIAPDKFKGSLTAQEAAIAMAEGVSEAYNYNRYNNIPCNSPLCIRQLPMADGGDGSLSVVEQQFKGLRVKCIVHDPLGREIEAEYLLNAKEAFIEMAAISGLELLREEERNPILTSTFGLGEAIKDACFRGAEKISLSIGGSATNDCGAGMLQALGMKYLLTTTRAQHPERTQQPKRAQHPERASQPHTVSNTKINEASRADIITGGDLQYIKSVDLTEVYRFINENHLKFKVICDVDNPLTGSLGATYIYSPQKGADQRAKDILELGVRNFAELTSVYHDKGCLFPGAGAAGGVGYAMHALLGAELVGGSLFFAELNHLDEMVEWADAVLTGEGCLDEQSFNGKVTGAMYDRCRRYKKRLYIMCGISKLQTLPDNTGVYSLASVSKDGRDSLEKAYKYLKEVTFNTFIGKNSNL